MSNVKLLKIISKVKNFNGRKIHNIGNGYIGRDSIIKEFAEEKRQREREKKLFQTSNKLPASENNGERRG